MADVTLVHHGVVPAAVHGDRVALEGHDQIRDHAAEGIEGLLSVAGTKYTTARAVAERITDTLLTKLQHARVACRTATTPLPGGTFRDIGLAIAEARREFDEGLPTDTIPHLDRRLRFALSRGDGAGGSAGAADAARARLAGDRRGTGARGAEGDGGDAGGRGRSGERRLARSGIPDPDAARRARRRLSPRNWVGTRRVGRTNRTVQRLYQQAERV